MIELVDALERLYAAYGPRGWWPLPSRACEPGRDDEGYLVGPSRPAGVDEAAARFEVAVAAILAQNTAWRGAAIACRNLWRADCLTPEAMESSSPERLAELVTPAGTYQLKAAYLRALSAAWPSIEASRMPTRERLLGIKGVGYETADCILLYCFGVPVFVADAYARSVLSRLGLVGFGDGYERVRRVAEESLALEADYLCEAHALLVEHAKRHCMARPACDGCPLASSCVHYENNERRGEETGKRI